MQAGDRVSILAHNSVAYFDLLFGLAKIGAIFTPLNWRLTATSWFIVERLFAQGHARRTGVCWRVGRDASHGRRRACGRPGRSRFGGCAGLRSRSGRGLAGRAGTARRSTPNCPTASSTRRAPLGRPKGAVLPHRQILWNCINTVVSWGLTEHDVSPVLTPLFHAGGLFAFMTPILYAGGRIVLAQRL